VRVILARDRRNPPPPRQWEEKMGVRPAGIGGDACERFSETRGEKKGRR
jgi:hypothetical protein